MVKPLGFPKVTPMTCFRETLGTMLARSLGVRVPDPALILIDNAFVAANADNMALGKRRMKAGLCFGSRFLGKGHPTPGHDTRFDTDNLIDSAVRIYGFDLTFHNCDRLPTNPNCLIKDGVVYAFDFERAFEFMGWRKDVEAIPPLHPNRLWVARRHVLYRVASKQRARLDSFVDAIGAFDSKAFDPAMLSLPSNWAVHVRTIMRHVQEIQAGLPTFRDNLLSVAPP